MDLRSRTVPDRRTTNPEPSEGSECEGGRVDIQGSPNATTIILDEGNEDLGSLFEAEETCQPNEFTPSKISDRATEREEPGFVCWPGQPMVKGEPVVDFDTPMREFMEGERYPQSFNREGRIPLERGHGQLPHIRSSMRDGQRNAPRPYGIAVDTAPGRDRFRPAGGDECGNNGNEGFQYERLLPQGARPKERVSANRPAPGIQAPRYEPEYRIPDQLLFEPRPYFPTFSGKHDEWDAFWLKFESMARRYNWSYDKQKEQLLFCLKDEALNFAVTLGPEVREDILLFSQALRDRFTHRTPPETVRASLNNIRRSSKETIQEYASRVRTMMNRAYPDIGPTETFNQMTIHHFLQGLPDQTIAYEVLIRKPRSLTEAVDMITWHECCKETTRKKAGVRQVTEEPYLAENFPETGVRRINGKRFVTEERLIQFGRDLKATMEKLLKDVNPTPEQEEVGKQDETMPKKSDGRSPICFYCNEPGHIATYCPVRAADFAGKQQHRRDKARPKSSENAKGLSQQAGTQTHC